MADPRPADPQSHCCHGINDTGNCCPLYLANGGIVERKGRILHIRDRERLEKLAGALDDALEEDFSR